MVCLRVPETRRDGLSGPCAVGTATATMPTAVPLCLLCHSTLPAISAPPPACQTISSGKCARDLCASKSSLTSALQHPPLFLPLAVYVRLLSDRRLLRCHRAPHWSAGSLQQTRRLSLWLQHLHCALLPDPHRRSDDVRTLQCSFSPFTTANPVNFSAWTVQGRDAFRSNGQSASLGVKAYAFTWSAMACFLISTVLFCLSGAHRNESVYTKRSSFGRSKSTRSRGSFIDAESQRRVKDDYS